MLFPPLAKTIIRSDTNSCGSGVVSRRIGESSGWVARKLSDFSEIYVSRELSAEKKGIRQKRNVNVDGGETKVIYKNVTVSPLQWCNKAKSNGYGDLFRST